MENVTRIKSGIAVHVYVSVKMQKSIMHAENTIFEVLLHVVVKMVNNEEVLLRFSDYIV